jgi:hypothetical protein
VHCQAWRVLLPGLACVRVYGGWVGGFSVRLGQVGDFLCRRIRRLLERAFGWVVVVVVAVG